MAPHGTAGQVPQGIRVVRSAARSSLCRILPDLVALAAAADRLAPATISWDAADAAESTAMRGAQTVMRALEADAYATGYDPSVWLDQAMLLAEIVNDPDHVADGNAFGEAAPSALTRLALHHLGRAIEGWQSDRLAVPERLSRAAGLLAAASLRLRPDDEH